MLHFFYTAWMSDFHLSLNVNPCYSSSKSQSQEHIHILLTNNLLFWMKGGKQTAISPELKRICPHGWFHLGSYSKLVIVHERKKAKFILFQLRCYDFLFFSPFSLSAGGKVSHNSYYTLTTLRDSF